MALKLLIKLPSRERPGVLLEAASRYATLCTNKADTTILITCDNDDDQMRGQDVVDALLALPVRVCIEWDDRTTKIGATNRGLPGEEPWDILLVASDDMWPIVAGFDDLIRKHMADRFQELDGCLWYHDGRQRRVCTMPVMGRKYFDRTGKVYEDGYWSYYADDEFTEVAQSLGRIRKVDLCIIKHEHPHYLGKVAEDGLYKFNRAHKARDKAYYTGRKAAGFP